MMRYRSRDTEGFVLVDALVAVALVASAGTAAYLVGGQLLVAQDRRLDGTMAIMTMRALAHEIQLGRSVASGETLFEGSGYSYVVREAASVSAGLATITLEARGIGNAPGRSVSFLAPVGTR